MRKMHQTSFSVAAFVLIVASFLSLSPGFALSELDRSIMKVLPSAQEDAWLSIGWQTNLMQARALAQQMRRPLFLWVMNGHPLTCT